MATARLNIRQLTRIHTSGEEESLNFEQGVNVLFGPPNSGKSAWLRTLDYLFGDPDPVEKALGASVAAQYVAARATMTVDNGPLVIERRWAPGDVRSRITVADDSITVDAFSDYFLHQLRLPVLRFPRGNPLAPRAFARLSWRMLYRHIYRHELSWTDLATEQPSQEQFACLMVLLGAGERVFPSAYGDLIERQREALELRARRDQFVAALEDVTRELLAVREATVALTPESLLMAQGRIEAELATLAARRTEVLEELQARTQALRQVGHQQQQENLSSLGDRLSALRARRDAAAQRLANGRERHGDLERHRRSVAEERTRLERARVAHDELADLRITHCPNCDQPIEREVAAGLCRVCMQPHERQADDAEANVQRLTFEHQQLIEEARELDELLQKLSSEEDAERHAMRDLEDEIRQLEDRLRPVRAVAAAILPPELAMIDEERGRLAEQLRQLQRVRGALSRRDDLTARIDTLSGEIARLEAEVADQAARVGVARREDMLSGGMNTYLNALNAGGGPPRWQGGRVGVNIGQRDVRFTLNGRDWRSEVGGTYACFFLVAYHYGLLSLTSDEDAAYPGLAIIDLPPNVSDNRQLTDQENYLVEPFIALLSRADLAGAQLIVSGHAYSGLQGVNRLALTGVYDSSRDATSSSQ